MLRFEFIETADEADDDGRITSTQWHVVAKSPGNDEIVWWTERYPDRREAENAVYLLYPGAVLMADGGQVIASDKRTTYEQVPQPGRIVRAKVVSLR